MRKELGKIENRRTRFTCEFVRYGKKRAYKGPPILTLLFKDIKNELGQIMTDHIWFVTNKGFQQFELTAGDVVSFDARVKQYWKGYQGIGYDGDEGTRTKDFKLSNPTNISCSKLKKDNQQHSLF